MSLPVAVLRTGAITSVGHNAPSTFAALRARLNHFTESGFIDPRGERVVAAPVEWPAGDDEPRSNRYDTRHMSQGYDPVQHPVHRQVELLARALGECAQNLPFLDSASVPLLVCTSELTRPGRPAMLDQQLTEGLTQRLRCKFAPQSAVFAYGQAGIGMAMHHAFELLRQHPVVVLAGVDSLTDFHSLSALHARGRVLASDQPDGYIPGEAACALLLGYPDQLHRIPPHFSNRTAAQPSPSPARHPYAKPQAPSALYCMGYSVQREMALPSSGQPIHGQALRDAINGALVPIDNEGSGSAQVGLRLCSHISTHYSAKEMALACARAGVSTTPQWCLADSLGETGAAAGPLSVAWTHAAMHKGYSPSTVALSLTASEEGERSALLLGFGPFHP